MEKLEAHIYLTAETCKELIVFSNAKNLEWFLELTSKQEKS